MSLHSIVNDGLTGRFLRQPRRAVAATQARTTGVARTTGLAVLLQGTSMRALETGLALTAIATALLIGLGR